MNLKRWLLSDLILPSGVQSKPESEYPWWRVMCLTGVDYFSTLGYQPGIAFLAAGFLSPFATLVLVLVTLFGALPVYKRVAAASPNGQGSIAMLENLFPEWKGKTLVLILLGFATTDFVITMTLSAADAATHLIHNPFTPSWMRSQMGTTLLLLALLGSVFLKGFKDAINIAVVLVGAYLGLNAIVASVALWDLVRHPHLFSEWSHTIFRQHSDPLSILGISLLLFPKLALGLSGFETGVAVIPLIQGENLKDRVNNAKRLLSASAVVMSLFLTGTSFVTTLLIPAHAFQRGGLANGRAMAFLAHQYLGDGFGTIYDLSTILILAFAGASAMAGLLNLIPRYLPRYGMAPEWARASRPLVLVFTSVAVTVTLLFRADVDAQGGAYATGVLVLITSASLAVTVAVWKQWLRWPFLLVTLIFVYTTVLNIGERPEGIKISSFFIGAIVILSLVSRAIRSTELRITGIQFDEMTLSLLAEDPDQIIRLVPRRPEIESSKPCDEVDARVRALHNLSPEESLYFFEVYRSDTSEFKDTLFVQGRMDGRHRVLFASSPVVANSIAALLIELGRRTGNVPHAYFHWTAGNPVANLFRYIFFGEGDTAPLSHEVIRRAIADPKHRPIIHVA